MKKVPVTIEKAEAVIRTIAAQHHTTVETVRLEMKQAMLAGLLNPDPKVQATWKSIPCEGEVPTPEELIVWAANRI